MVSVRPLVVVTKFVGTVSLGLLTGLSYSLNTVYPPTLLALPTAPSARSAHKTLAATARRRTRLLATLSSISFVSAWILSPRGRKHPYLLYTALVTWVGGVGVDAAATRGWLAAPLRLLGGRHGGDAEAAAMRDVSSSDDEEEEEVLVGTGGEEVNGEVVRRKVEGMRAREGLRSKVLGLGLFMSVVGIWGDGA